MVLREIAFLVSFFAGINLVRARAPMTTQSIPFAASILEHVSPA